MKSIGIPWFVPIPTHSDIYSDLIRTPIPRDSDGPNLLA